jgi:Zn-dependent M28 family amino/carboxypeptidase
MRRITFLSLIFFAACRTAQVAAPLPARTDPAVTAALNAITADALRGHIEFLADDLLEGRETGTRGFDVAAAYVASEFRSVGLSPGAKGSWYQPVTLRSAKLDRTRTSLTLIDANGKEELLQLDADYVMSADPARDETTAEGNLVFVGYGITSPELGRDDYASIDARGKIVVLLAGAPEIKEHTLRAYFSDSTNKSRIAAEHGAVGILSLRVPSDQRRIPWEKVVAAVSAQSVMTPVDPVKGPIVAVPQIAANAYLSPSGVEKVFRGAAQTPEQIDEAKKANTLRSFDLPFRARIRRASVSTLTESRNVVGLLPGSDPKLADEYLVVSAHLDHLGISATGTDRINNGALDNASGVATIMEVARAFHAMPSPPRRSILFVALTGEEKGELGSEYFARNPPLEHGRLVADINIDMFQMIFPIGDMVARGQQHSTLQKPVERAAAELGVTLSPDPEPEQVRLVRSDQYSFIKQGIPAMIIKAGFQSSEPSIDGPKKMKEWTEKMYHSPSDDTNQPIDYPSGVRFAQLNTLIAWYVAIADETPRWNEGDFFARTFAK